MLEVSGQYGFASGTAAFPRIIARKDKSHVQCHSCKHIFYTNTKKKTGKLNFSKLFHDIIYTNTKRNNRKVVYSFSSCKTKDLVSEDEKACPLLYQLFCVHGDRKWKLMVYHETAPGEPQQKNGIGNSISHG